MSNLRVPKDFSHHGSAMWFFQCSKVLLLFNDAGPRTRLQESTCLCSHKKCVVPPVLPMCPRKLCACISARRISTKNAPTLKRSVRMRRCTLCTCLYIHNCPYIHILSYFYLAGISVHYPLFLLFPIPYDQPLTTIYSPFTCHLLEIVPHINAMRCDPCDPFVVATSPDSSEHDGPRTGATAASRPSRRVRPLHLAEKNKQQETRTIEKTIREQ